MERTEVIVNSRGIRRRSINTSEYRRRRTQGNRANKENESNASFSNLMIIRIVLCILICAMGSVFLGSKGEKVENLKSELDEVLSENISFEDLKQIKNELSTLTEKGITGIGINNNIEIDSDYIDEMNESEVFYKNQKK